MEEIKSFGITCYDKTEIVFNIREYIFLEAFRQEFHEFYRDLTKDYEWRWDSADFNLHHRSLGTPDGYGSILLVSFTINRELKDKVLEWIKKFGEECKITFDESVELRT